MVEIEALHRLSYVVIIVIDVRSSSAIMDFTRHNLQGGQVGLWTVNKHPDFALKNDNFLKFRI